MPEPAAIRVEHDALGDVEVPAEALYGAHTVRALESFPVGGPRLRDRPDLLRALARVKIAEARANAAQGLLAPGVADAIVAAAREVVAGEHAHGFPLPVVQGGGGTSTNMNVNEVLANRANELLGRPRGTYAPVHPNDHVNRSQSTNDVVPTAIQLAVLETGATAVAALGHLAETLGRKAADRPDRLRLGRTCLQDAVPLTTGQTHGGQAAGVARTRDGLRSALEGLLAVPLGATVLGTGIGAPPGHAGVVVSLLAEETGLPLVPATDLFDALAHFDPYLEVVHALDRAMLVVAKIAADLRLLSSGPVGGLGELALPSLQPGSSAMPGKVNPVLPELVLQVSYDVRGAVTTVEAAVAGGELELNVMEPVIARRLLEALDDAASVTRAFADRCVAGLEWVDAALSRSLRGSLGSAVERAVEAGYETALRERTGKDEERRP